MFSVRGEDRFRGVAAPDAVMVVDGRRTQGRCLGELVRATMHGAAFDGSQQAFFAITTMIVLSRGGRDK